MSRIGKKPVTLPKGVKVSVNGAEAVVEGAKGKLSCPIPAVITLDVIMPEMDGWEVYQSMKAEETSREIPVIIVTAKAQSIDRVLGLHIAKVDDYIAKPFSPQELMNSVAKVLHLEK